MSDKQPELPDVRYLFGNPSGSRAILTHCPNPEHDDRNKSYAIYADGGWCFGCGFKETVAEILERVGENGEKLPKAPLGRSRRYTGYARGWDAESLRSSVVLWHELLMAGPRQHRQAYLKARGLRQRTLTDELLGHTGTAFTIPVWHPHDDGKLVGVRFRRDEEYDPDGNFKYWNARGQPSVLVYRPNARGSPTVICEGELDALLLAQYGIDSVTSTGGAKTLALLLSRDWRNDRYRLGDRELFIATDLDDAGEEAAAQLAAALGGALRRVRWDEAKDIGEALLGVEEARREGQLRRLLLRAEHIEGG